MEIQVIYFFYLPISSGTSAKGSSSINWTIVSETVISSVVASPHVVASIAGGHGLVTRLQFSGQVTSK